MPPPHSCVLVCVCVFVLTAPLRRCGVGGNLGTQALDLADRAVAPTGPSSFNLVLAAGALTAGATYTLQLSATSANPTGRGQGQTSFQVNVVGAHGCLAARPPSLARVLMHAWRSRRPGVCWWWTRLRAYLATRPLSPASLALRAWTRAPL
jgi:hypothetical protein